MASSQEHAPIVCRDPLLTTRRVFTTTRFRCSAAGILCQEASTGRIDDDPGLTGPKEKMKSSQTAEVGLTGYSRILVPFFARHKIARQVILTKSADVANLLDLDHGGHTILSWSLNPPEIGRAFEAGAPPVEERIAAMARCAADGYPVRAVIMPIIPVDRWQDLYERFIAELLDSVPLDRITLGGVCSFSSARRLMEAKLGADNVISRALTGGERSPDGRHRYALAQRKDAYSRLVRVIRRRAPSLPIGLCLEEPVVFEALGMTSAIGRCNCVL